MGEKLDGDDGLGLTLSLRCPQNLPPPSALNLMHSTPAGGSNADGRPKPLLIDVNQAADCEGEVRVLTPSPNRTVSKVMMGKRKERASSFEDNGNNGNGSGSDGGGGGGERKKLRLSKDQAAVLERTFKEHSTLNPKQKVSLAKQINLRPRQVEVWFQNRRARTKLKQTEVECEYLKKCCESLKEENKKLQKEVNELRALKVSSQFYMHMKQPPMATTLSMCSSCHPLPHVPSSSSSAAASTSVLLLPPPDGANARRHNLVVDPTRRLPALLAHTWTRPKDSVIALEYRK